MSFLRHGEINRLMDSENVPRRPSHNRLRPHRFDEFPAGYSSAGCAHAEPASASPAGAHLAGIGSSSTIELHRTVNRLLTLCLTQGDNPITSFITLYGHSTPTQSTMSLLSRLRKMRELHKGVIDCRMCPNVVYGRLVLRSFCLFCVMQASS
jgi:hypothetical protein